MDWSFIMSESFWRIWITFGFDNSRLYTFVLGKGDKCLLYYSVLSIVYVCIVQNKTLLMFLLTDGAF
jgi:hypothetical protein